MKPILESITKTLTGYYEIGILYPPGKLYTYKITSARVIETLKFYVKMGWTNKMVALVKKMEILNG